MRARSPKTRLPALGAWLALGAGACGGDALSPFETHEVALGSAAAKLDLSTCQHTDCAHVQNPRPMLQFELEHACEVDSPTALGALWEVQMAPLAEACRSESPEYDPGSCVAQLAVDNTDCPLLGACQLRMQAVAPAPDGSVWATAIAAGPRVGELEDPTWGGVLLYHYADDGSLLRSELLASDQMERANVGFSSALTVDARGHAFVRVTRTVTPDSAASLGEVTNRLFEFDPQGNRIGTAIEIGPEETASARSSEIRIAAAADELALGQSRFGSGGIARLDSTTRTLQWVQSRAGRLGFAEMVGDSRGELSVLTRSPNGGLSGRLEHYGPDGRLLWERAFGEPGNHAFGGAGLGVDQHGELALLISSEPPPMSGTVVSKLSASGEPLWRTTLPDLMASVYSQLDGPPAIASSYPSTITVLPSGKLVYLPVTITLFDGSSTSSILALSADGARCRQYTWTSQSPTSPQMALGPALRLYMLLPGGLVRLAFSDALLP